MKHPQSILITGASSGIGEALANSYAADGVHLTLTGRDKARLEQVAEDCRALGANVMAHRVDVTEREKMAELIAHVDQTHPLDLVIANAGVSAGSGGLGESEEQARLIFDVNVGGVLNTIWPAIEPMKNRGHGQIALVSSLAGFMGLPGAPAYSATKVAVKAYGEALHGALKPDGIAVSVICPGFVKSRITARNNFPMPLLMDAPKAAKIIRRGLEKKKLSIIFPRRLAFLTWLTSIFPPALRIWLMSRAPKKD
ncbi:SDR family NAD(P)-dependent oxidoreductase [Magnetovibrio sp. PR-2]|uniref:SDR family NAD(P)-dependent oxidoreductase n=1 Tax=Magnetovibrio sp. PR-2 TaxID=3120356 RepID=UPI002FCE04BD